MAACIPQTETKSLQKPGAISRIPGKPNPAIPYSSKLDSNKKAQTMPRTISFTDYVCQHIQQYDLKDTNLHVVLPTLRLQRTIRQKLIRQAQTENKLPLWLPKFESMDQIVFQWTGLRKAQPIELQVRLYQSYRHIYQQDREPARNFDQFSDWGRMLVSDFNQIDNQLAPAQEILSYIAEDKRIGSWHLDLGSSKNGSLQSHYLAFYQKLGRIYQDFTQRLIEEGCAYTGLAGRIACQNLLQLLQDGLPRNDFYLFAGLNALTAAEHSLIKSLIRAGQAEILWNADRYYMDDPVQEAGHFLREYRKDPDLNHHLQDEDIADNLKNIRLRIIECPQNTGQAKTVAQILQSLPRTEQPRTLIVLNDESLFAPLMNSLPEGTDYNVSIASPLSGTFSGSLFSTLLQAKEFIYQNQNRNLQAGFIMSLLRNPLFRRLSALKDNPTGKDLRKSQSLNGDHPKPDAEDCTAEDIANWLISGHQLYFSQTEFRSLFPSRNPMTDQICRFIFGQNPQPPQDAVQGRAEEDSQSTPSVAIGSPLDSLSFFIGIAQTLIEIDQNNNHAQQTDLFQTTDPKQRLNPFETSFLKTLINEAQEQTKALRLLPEEELGPLSSLHLLQDLLSGISLNYTGNEHVILLSMNEGFLPSTPSQESFLLYNLKKHYHIPTETEQTAMQAHHFYSLLQNCRQATLLYLGSQPGKTEKSRFLLQLEHELPDNLFQGNPADSPMPSEEGNVQGRLPAQANETVARQAKPLATETGFCLLHPQYQPRSLRVPKSAPLLQAVRRILDKGNDRSGISFSAMSAFLQCPLRFYFQYLLRLGEPPEVSDQLDHSLKGKVFHRAMENFFTGNGPDKLDKRGRLLQQEDADILRRHSESLLQQALEKEFSGGQYDHGANYLAFEELKIWMQRYAAALEEEIQNGELCILRCEEFMHQRENLAGSPVNLIGYADRVDTYRPAGSDKTYIRIVDYKTGKTKNLCLDDWDQLKDKDYAQAFQLLMYLYLYTSMHPEEKRPLQACICSLKNQGRMASLGGCQIEEIPRNEIMEHTRQFLEETLQNMLDPATDFCRTENPDNCEYCHYKEFCRFNTIIENPYSE